MSWNLIATEDLAISHSFDCFIETTETATYRGVNFHIAIGHTVFNVRIYSDLPDMSFVISPKSAREMPRVGLLVSYLILTLEFDRLAFYDPDSDQYREVDVKTMEFISQAF
jgi:hypothetical protein